MNPLLVTIGLLLLASALTLLSLGGRSWLLAVAKGIGVQGLFGLLVSALCVMVTHINSAVPIWRQIGLAVEQSVFHAGGWSARAIYGNLHPGQGLEQHLDSFLPIVAVQAGVLALLMASRRMRDEAVFDPVHCFLVVLALANTLINATATVFWTS